MAQGYDSLLPRVSDFAALEDRFFGPAETAEPLSTRGFFVAALRRSRLNGRMTKKIIHIIPGGGWKAIFADIEGKQNPRDLVCWAAIEDTGETSVEGMVAREG